MSRAKTEAWKLGWLQKCAQARETKPEAEYYTPIEVATMLKISQAKVRMIFTGKPGVIILATPLPGRRFYRTIRIPASAIEQLKCT